MEMKDLENSKNFKRSINFWDKRNSVFGEKVINKMIAKKYNCSDMDFINSMKEDLKSEIIKVKSDAVENINREIVPKDNDFFGYSLDY